LGAGRISSVFTGRSSLWRPWWMKDEDRSGLIAGRRSYRYREW
jgi:hypothetical protein